MSAIQQLLTDHIDIWTAADTAKKSGRGRSSGTAGSVYGVKKLRELILELAVRGKLVPQDASDEPASELLKRIAAEKAKLVAEGKIKKSKPLAEITDDEKPFELPINWKWAKLGLIGYTQTGATPSKSNPEYFGSDIPFIKPGDIYPNHIEYSNEGLSFYGAEKSGRIAPSNSLLMVCIGTIGKCNLVQTDCSFNQQINSVTPYIFNSNFLLAVCRSVHFNAEAWDRSSSTTIAILNKGNWEEISIPIPPITEQHRIVAKVDELMTLCDQLENQHNNAAVAHEKLVTHLLGTLTRSQNAEDFNTNWQRISEHFDTLFTTEASIDALKQTLLQLAVMGKLVPQDPNDEPASELLKRIQAEKAKLIAEGKIKKDKPLAVITEEEKPFDLPVGWEWARLGDISQLKGGMAYQSSAFVETGKNQVIRMGNVRPWRLRIDEKAVFIDNSVADKTMEYSLNIDDIVITMTGTIGKRDYVYSARIHESDVQHKKLFLNQRLCSVRPYLMKPRYLDMAMKDDRLLDVIFSNATGTANQANISMAALNLWLIPIPPIKEQNFIVTKVDELLALCNQLKASITSANQLQQKLADVLVERLI